MIPSKAINIIGLFLLMISALGAASYGSEEDAAVEASLVHLIAFPERYMDKRIVVQGYLAIGLNAPSLFLTSDHARHADSSSAIVLYDSDLLSSDCSDSWVRVIGRFNEGALGNGILNVEFVQAMGRGLACLDRRTKR